MCFLSTQVKYYRKGKYLRCSGLTKFLSKNDKNPLFNILKIPAIEAHFFIIFPVSRNLPDHALNCGDEPGQLFPDHLMKANPMTCLIDRHADDVPIPLSFMVQSVHEAPSETQRRPPCISNRLIRTGGRFPKPGRCGYRESSIPQKPVSGL
jgi:hypothetical protein